MSPASRIIGSGKMCLLKRWNSDYELVFLLKPYDPLRVEYIVCRRLARFVGGVGCADSSISDQEKLRMDRGSAYAGVISFLDGKEILKGLLRNWECQTTITDWLEYLESVEIRFGLRVGDLADLKFLSQELEAES